MRKGWHILRENGTVLVLCNASQDDIPPSENPNNIGCIDVGDSTPDRQIPLQIGHIS